MPRHSACAAFDSQATGCAAGAKLVICVCCSPGGHGNNLTLADIAAFDTGGDSPGHSRLAGGITFLTVSISYA
jgi:hypothetical protein